MRIYNSTETIETDEKIRIDPNHDYNEKYKTTIGNKVIKQFDRSFLKMRFELRLSHSDFNKLKEILDDVDKTYIYPDYILPSYEVLADVEVVIRTPRITEIVSVNGILYYYLEIFADEVIQT